MFFERQRSETNGKVGLYRGETSGRPAVAVAGGEDFEHPAQALRRSEASSAIPVRRPVRAVGAGLRCVWFLAEAAAFRGLLPGAETPAQTKGFGRGAKKKERREEGGASTDLLPSSRSSSRPTDHEFDRPLGVGGWQPERQTQPRQRERVLRWQTVALPGTDR